jgi:SIT4-associating protein SAP185/190
MFWRFGGYASISPVDTLLNKPDVTLEELLEESELIQELKQHNTKLIEYLREDNVLKRLMDYVIAPSLIDDEEEPEDERRALISGEKDARSTNQKQAKGKQETLELEDLGKAEKLRLKYAYIACEILSSETWSILESMMLSETYLRDFWEFMKRPAPLDSLQAGYFTKVNETLFDRKTEEMLAFFKSLPGIVPAMLQHVDNPMVMDLLLKIISLERAEGGLGIADVSILNRIYMLHGYADGSKSTVAQDTGFGAHIALLPFLGPPSRRPNLGGRLPEGNHHHLCKCDPE